MTEDQKIKVENMINSDKIFLMLKGTPEQPRCGFSARVVHALNNYNASYNSFNIFEDSLFKDKISKQTIISDRLFIVSRRNMSTPKSVNQLDNSKNSCFAVLSPG